MLDGAERIFCGANTLDGRFSEEARERFLDSRTRGLDFGADLLCGPESPVAGEMAARSLFDWNICGVCRFLRTDDMEYSLAKEVANPHECILGILDDGIFHHYSSVSSIESADRRHYAVNGFRILAKRHSRGKKQSQRS
nr:hypothetical protein [Variovorax boronicumulans]